MAKEKEIRAEYWKFAEEEIRKALPELYEKASLNPDRSAFDSIRKDNMLITCIANTKSKVISVGIYFRKPNCAARNKAKADLILEKSEQIRALLSFPEVKIAPAEGREPSGQRNDYNVLFSANMDVLDRNNWDRCREFHCKTSKEIYEHVFLKLMAIDDYDSRLVDLHSSSGSEKDISYQTPHTDFFSLRAAAMEAWIDTSGKGTSNRK